MSKQVGKKAKVLVIIVISVLIMAIAVCVIAYLKYPREKKEWRGEYQRADIVLEEQVHTSLFQTGFFYDEVKSYSEYSEIIDEINESADTDIEKKYGDEYNFVLIFHETHSDFYLLNCHEKKSCLDVTYYECGYNMMAEGMVYGTNYVFIAIPTHAAVGTEVVFEDTSDEPHINKHNVPVDEVEAKPIIYLYPEEETVLTVSLGYPERIICSYPGYENGWNVLAEPNGDLTDLNTGRYLYSLYYESISVVLFTIEEEGFVVRGSDSAAFLEEKLAILGLNEREAEEFIVYWLPKLEANEYNYIRFASLDEINENMPISFSEEPDTFIRVLMVYTALDEPIEVEEQVLETPVRQGFVAVEWGGTEF